MIRCPYTVALDDVDGSVTLPDCPFYPSCRCAQHVAAYVLGGQLEPVAAWWVEHDPTIGRQI